MQLTLKRIVFSFLILITAGCASLFGQPLSGKQAVTQQDSLRGSLNENRTWWDVKKYAIYVEPDYASKTIKGYVQLTIQVIKNHPLMQLDLQEPMQIDRIESNGKTFSYTRNGNVFYVNIPGGFPINSRQTLLVHFSGKPVEAIRPPWDGGWIWKKDKAGNPWMSVACQGLGASVWYPCKDHQSDEPDEGAELRIVAPAGLTAVGNGRLINQSNLDSGRTVYTWEVKNPINNYNIIPYIGKYAHFSEVFDGEKGKLDCDYWVLEENLEKAKKQFQQVKPMLQCFEHWFGPYPFYEDGYKLVESPHLGMEHQSAVAYGNQYKNGYLGKDLSGTGWGLKWDFIIIHETGHEWFGNNITTKDIADMWVHEGFTNYSETIFTQCQNNLQAGNEYQIGSRRNIANDIPIIGQYGVNKEGSGDMYAKASSMIHIIRQLIGDDEKFRQLLRSLNKVYYHKTVSSAEIEAYINQFTGKDLTKIYDQYLRTIQIPVLEYRISKGRLSYRWANSIEGFNMPVKITVQDKTSWIQPGTDWKQLPGKNTVLVADPNFNIQVKQVN
ncbi:M1 family metallopeptidase [Flavihumibacter sp. CACIAM 22H1]|uniref:M1 family metallopeptidase n=1 Tax=Flavihumibacter sp. CACIAM 22H1 TaxID=1812911 RepID=UPI0007A7F6BA|nr:M1 family metallopeptidase [Flavihumibacter sp. CACIAM 22H1]KYP14244.1 MAG: peptidase M1 [Flavihumibacter sp. CACIAM 22H1]